MIQRVLQTSEKKSIILRIWSEPYVPNTRVPEFLWQSSKWVHQFVFKIFKYTSGLEVLGCSINTN